MPRLAVAPLLVACATIAATFVVSETLAQKKPPEKTPPEKTQPQTENKELLNVLPAPAQTPAGQEKPSTKIQLPEGGVDEKTPIITNTDLITFNADMSPRELALWRLAFVMASYLIGYVLYPSRIVRTIKHVCFGSHEAATVLEHRLKDAVGKFKVLARGTRRAAASRPHPVEHLELPPR